MNQSASLQQIDAWSVEGAFTDLNRLVGLHRFAGEFQLSARRRAGAAMAGEWKTHQRGRGIDFEEVRLYQPGDDIRSIDWRVTARCQQPHTRVYREERERPVMLAADMRSSMFFGSQQCFKSVMCASLMSCLGWSALAGRDRVGGLVFGDRDYRDLRPRRSKHSVLEWIRQLDNFSHRLSDPCAGSPQTLASQLEKMVHICKPGTAAVIASDFHDFDEHCRKRLFQLSRHSEVSLFLISDPLEHQLPARGRFWVTDGRRRQLLSESSHHGQGLQQRLELLERHCGALGVPLYQLRTDDHLLSRLRAVYGRQRIGRRRQEDAR